MFSALSVSAVFALAGAGTGDTGVETFTILLLALTFFTVASFLLFLLGCTAHLMRDTFPGFSDLGLVVVVVGAAVAGTLFGAHFSLPEALTVHLQTFGLLASASSLFLLGYGSRGVDVGRVCLQLVLD